MPANLINGSEVSPANPSELDVVQAVRAAHAAADEWAQRDPASRARIVLAWADRLERAADQLAAADAGDSGVSLAQARFDLDRALTDVRTNVARAATSVRPLGVIGVIGARAMVTRTLLPRLALFLVGGNTVVVKPSSRATKIVSALLPSFADAEVPPGVVNVTFGPGETLGKFLCEHPGVPGIFLAGRSATGRQVVAAISAQLKRTSLALGAKNAAIVLKDADLDLAIPCLARAAFRRGGVDPFALSKILVAREIASDVLERLRAAAPQSITLPTETDAAEFARYVALARSENGALTGGDVDGLMVTPAIVSELTHCSEIHQDELLVPLLTVNEIKYAHEGVKWINVTPYGRAAAIFTRNVASARKLAGQLNVGTVWLNGWLDDPSSALGVDQKTSAFGEPDALVFGQRPAVVIA